MNEYGYGYTELILNLGAFGLILWAVGYSMKRLIPDAIAHMNDVTESFTTELKLQRDDFSAELRKQREEFRDELRHMREDYKQHVDECYSVARYRMDEMADRMTRLEEST